jgi:hypothetical protein
MKVVVLNRGPQVVNVGANNMKANCKKFHKANWQYSKRGTLFCADCPTELEELDKELDKLCPIAYMHDFPDYPCKMCNGNKWYWLKFKAFMKYGLGSEIIKFVLLFGLLALMSALIW